MYVNLTSVRCMFVWEWFNRTAAKQLFSQPDSEWNNQPPSKPTGLVPSHLTSLPALLYWDLVQSIETDVRDVLHSEKPVPWDYWISLCLTLPNAQLYTTDKNIDIYLLPINVKLCNQLNYVWKQKENRNRQFRDYRWLLTKLYTLHYTVCTCIMLLCYYGSFKSFKAGTNIHGT